MKITLNDLTNEIKNTGNISIDGIFWITEQNGTYLTNYNEIHDFIKETYNDKIAMYYLDVIWGFNEAGAMLGFASHYSILTKNKIFELEEYLNETIRTSYDSIEDLIEEFEGKTLMELHEYCYEVLLWKIGKLNKALDECRAEKLLQLFSDSKEVA